MPSDPEQFVLRSTETSPFGRKVRIAAEALGLASRITLLAANPLDEADTLRAQNPLGKMPCLLRYDGSALYDSGVIIEFLADAAGDEQMIPARGPARFEALTRAALADGISEAAILIVYETRFRDPGMHSDRWLKHQRGKIMRGLAAFEADPPDPAKTEIVAIGLACALGYLDWRKQVDWRKAYSGLVAWLAAFSKNEPAFERTRKEGP